MTSRTLLALSGGVDSSTAAALTLTDDVAPIDAIAVTLGLWGGERESTSCSTADGVAARHVADQLGVAHEYVDWTEDFNQMVVGQFVDYAKAGRTANPCITCNKTFKADRLFGWAAARGFHRIVTGHYARAVSTADGPRIGRAVDVAKDQSYVLCAFTSDQIARLHLPLGELTKPQVRDHARRFGLDVADKPESMGLCFSPRKVLATAALGDVAVVDVDTRRPLGEIPVGIAAVGQRKGLGIGGTATPKYVVDIRPDAVVVGDKTRLAVDATPVTGWTWVGGPVTGDVTFQTSAHGTPAAGHLHSDTVHWDAPHIRVAPGQIVVAYTPYDVGGETVDCVVGWGEAT